MTTVFFDADHDDQRRRSSLYAGDLYVYSPTAETRAFAHFAEEMIREAFGDLDPEAAQHHMSVEDYATLLGKLKPAFIHHPESKRHLGRILESFGCDSEATYFEVPKMRSSTSDGYLTAGIAYAWHPHRDTWYSAPQCQINWWMPIFPIERENTMAFHPRHWDEPVENSSADYNYYRWNMEHRGTHVTQYINHDPRPLPRARGEVHTEPQLRVVCPVGGMVLFSAAQLHSSVPNTSGKTRFSVDFRTVNADDLRGQRGAHNIDSQCTGTVLREFRRATDLSELPDEIVAAYEDGTEGNGDAVYQSEGMRTS